MMEYRGVVKQFHSVALDEDVSVLKYTSTDSIPYCNCDRCGKPIKKIMYVVQNDHTDVEMLYLGAECIKHLV